MPVKIVHKSSSNKSQTGAKSGHLDPPPGKKPGLTGVVSQPFIDKITIVVKPATEQDAAEMHSGQFVAFKDTSMFLKTDPITASGYQGARFVHIESSKARPLIQFKSYSKKLQSIRIEFNPRKLGTDGLMELAACMTSIMDQGWEYVVMNGHVTRIDVAVDIVGVRVEDFLCLTKQGITSTIWAVDGHAQSLSLGKKGNKTLVYSVKAKRLAKDQGWTGLSKIRVERRLISPAFHDLAKLEQLPNPFTSLTLTKPLPPLPPGVKKQDWQIFGDSVQVRGLTAALALLPKARKSKYRAYLKSHAQPWWVPATFWENWAEIVEASRLTAYNP